MDSVDAVAPPMRPHGVTDVQLQDTVRPTVQVGAGGPHEERHFGLKIP